MVKAEESRSKSKDAGIIQLKAANTIIAAEQVKLLGRDKSKDTTKKTSDKPSKVSKQMQSKAPTSLGLVVDK